MSCDLRIGLVVVTFTLVACADTPTVIGITANANQQVSLGPGEPDGAPDPDAEYLWELVAKPTDSNVTAPQGKATALFTPDRRGMFIIDRRLRYGVSDRITHEFDINVVGIPPSAVAEGDESVSVGASVRLDGGKSQSAEGLPLTFQWRLAERPRDSVAVLSDAHTAVTGFVGDIAGSYAVELAVFDGELWSEMPAKLVVTVQ
jgi:hypothetical protein